MSNKNRGRDKFNRFKSCIIILSKFYDVLPLKMRNKLLEVSRMTQGNIGLVIRYTLIKSIARKCGDNVSIHPGVYLFSPDKLILGENVSIHPMCYIDSTGYIEIGNNVSIAHGATILSTTHEYKSFFEPIKDQKLEFKKTIIASNVWIGAKATILAGTIISEGSIIAAGAVVTSNVDKNKIVAGVPAKIIKDRL